MRFYLSLFYKLIDLKIELNLATQSCKPYFQLDDMNLVNAYRRSGEINEAEPSIADIVEK